MSKIQQIVAKVKLEQKALVKAEKNISKSLNTLLNEVNRITVQQWKETFKDKNFKCWDEGVFSIDKTPFSDIDFMGGSHTDNWKADPIDLRVYYKGERIFAYKGKWTSRHYDLDKQVDQQFQCPVSVCDFHKFVHKLTTLLGITVYHYNR